jgi:predicted ATPase/DNA-binding SARP family transcriptional activator
LNERVQVAMLGPLEVSDDAGSPREVSGTRLRALLVLLALRAGQVVPASSLIDELWGERLPADAPNALQALVSRLRRALGEPAAIGSGPAGYQLAADRDDIDVFRFERLASRGRAALAAGRPAEATGLLGQALTLWRGEPLPDAAQTATGGAAIARLTELRLAVTEDRIEAELRLDAAQPRGRGERAPQLAAELEGLLAASPTRETLAALLMRALTAAGRRGAALRVYERTRNRLADELGADPSPQLAALHVELLRAGWQPGAAPGANHALPVSPPTAAADRGREYPGNLPAALTSFIGREDDLTDVRGLLQEHRLVTLTGPGGAGKTRLAVESAQAALDGGGPAAAGGPAFPGGAWLAELAPVTDPADVAATVLSAFGLREQALLVTRPAPAGGEDALDRLIGALATRRALLVLDNCEHLVAAAATLADRVLARCPGIRILATSREPLNITGEALWPVGPLPGPRAERLFAERAAAVSPGFRLTPDNSAAVARVCRSLDGMPLAIELAAARTRAMTPAHIADRLDQRFRLLTGGSRTALPRHQTLRAVVDWSWELLADTERVLLRRLSVFTGGATLEAAEQVCATPPVAADDVLDLLTALADKSLLTLRQTPDGPRYWLLETIREYGRDRLADAGEAGPLRRRHAGYFLRFAERAGPHLFGAEQLDWLRLMTADADNVHMAIRGAAAAGDQQTAVGLFGAFGWYWWLRSMKKEGGDLAALALRGAPDSARAPADPQSAAQLLTAYGIAGMLVMDSARNSHGVAWLHEAEMLAERLAPPPDSSSMAHAVATMSRPLRVIAESGGRDVPGSLAAAVNDPSPWVSGLARVIRGQVSLNQGGLADQAESDFRTAVAAFEGLGERWGLAMAVSGLAQIEEWRGEQAAAAAHYQQAASLAAELGTTEDETQFRLLLARVLWRSGGADRDRARAELARALRDAQRLGWPEVTAFAAYMAGDLARRDGNTAAARQLLDQAARVAEEQHGALAQIAAMTLTAQGYLAAGEGDLTGARRWHDRALALSLPRGDASVVAETLTGMADVAARDGNAEQAAVLLGAADGVRGAPHRSDDDGARVAAAARALLGPADYSAAFQRGQQVTLATLEAALRALLLTPGA